MKDRKSIVVSKSTLVAIDVCREMIHLALGNEVTLQDAAIDFEECSGALHLMPVKGYVELLRVEVRLRVINQGSHDDRWLAMFRIAKCQDGNWVRAEGWLLLLTDLLTRKTTNFNFRLNEKSGLERATSPEKKVLVVSVRYTIVDDRSEKIVEVLSKHGQCESELFKCLDSHKLDFVRAKIVSGDYRAMFVVWESLFDVGLLREFVQSIREAFPDLHLVAASDLPEYREILKQAGCSAEVETATHPEVFPKQVLRAIGL